MSVTVGVIGCGSIAGQHKPGLERAGARVKWVCDVVKANADSYVSKFGAKYTADFHDILRDPEVQAVDILTSSAFHKSLCLEAIAAGKAVICEKTLATNPEDAAEIVTAATKKGTILYTAYMKRFLPSVQKAKELLPSIGQIISTHIRVHQPWGADIWGPNPKEGFLHTPPGGVSQIVKSYGGGILVCGGSHTLDLVCHFLGRPKRLFAVMSLPKDRDYDNAASCLMETEQGPCLYDAVAHMSDRAGYLNDGWDERIELIGTQGRMEVFSPFWCFADVKPSMLVHYDNATGERREHRFHAVSPFVPELAFFLQNIEKGVQGSQSRMTGYDVDELISHIGHSARSGQAVDLKWRI